MALEVEVKYRAPDRARLLERLASIGAAFVGEERHRDCYFAPPHRDFAKTDEALRIRRTEAVGWITYKGPKLDGVTKTRKEIEAALDPKSADYLGEILKELSFKPVREVVKTRQVYTLAYQGFPVSIALDSVEGLEGAFAELEIHAEDEDFDDARSAILSLAGAMELKDSERRSYLELVLASGAT
jgi:adenylate cyclase, class 2